MSKTIEKVNGKERRREKGREKEERIRSKLKPAERVCLEVAELIDHR
jgi:hypothetical protein